MSKRSRLEVRIGDDDEAAPGTEWWYAHARALMCRLWETDDDRRRKRGREDAPNGNACIEIEISRGWVKRWVKTDDRRVKPPRTL